MIPAVVIYIEGGMVQGATTNGPITVIVVDKDLDADGVVYEERPSPWEQLSEDHKDKPNVLAEINRVMKEAADRYVINKIADIAVTLPSHREREGEGGTHLPIPIL